MAKLADIKKRKARRPLLVAFSEGKTIEEAARTAGVSQRSVYRWCEDDPELAEAVAEAKAAADDQVEAATFKNCLDPDAAHNTLRMFWLKCRRPDVYRDTPREPPLPSGDYIFRVPDPGDIPPRGDAGAG